MHTLAILGFDPSAVSSLHYAFAISALVACVVLYLLYKLMWPRDFGVPVRRKALCRQLRIVKDQMAYVPLWWSDIQVQRALRAHWRHTLASSLPPPLQPAERRDTVRS
ncbi:MAG: hypothetical protein ABR564_05460 [Candidatus Dormibacteria bacterium]